MRRLHLLALAAMGAALLLVSPAAAATVSVTVGPGGDFSYFPDPQTINVNDTVHWVWGSNLHSTTSGTCTMSTCTPDGNWNSGLQSNGATFDHMFPTAGTFHYYCTQHGPLMQGTIIVNPPTGATLVSFSAVRSRGGVVVTWRTASEIRTLGFHLYRGQERVTRKLIPAHGDVRGATYSFVDRAARGTPVRYRLRAVHPDGSQTWLGLAKVT